MSDREYDDLIDLIAIANRALVEDTSEAMLELGEIAELLRRRYNLTRVVPRGPLSSEIELPEPLYAAAPQMLKALQHVAEYLDELSENYETGRKPPGLICAEQYVHEAIRAAGA